MDCRYVAVADVNDHALKVFTLPNGKEVLSLKYAVPPDALAWNGRELAVGTLGGEVYLYRVSVRKLKS